MPRGNVSSLEGDELAAYVGGTVLAVWIVAFLSVPSSSKTLGSTNNATERGTVSIQFHVV